MTTYPAETHIIGGVDTHKDLHVAAVVDHRDRVLGTERFPTTRHGYRLMLAWMRSFGDLRRVGVECSGSYGAGLLRYMQSADVEVLEVTAPDRHVRRGRGKNDDYDAESAAHAARSRWCRTDGEYPPCQRLPAGHRRRSLRCSAARRCRRTGPGPHRPPPRWRPHSSHPHGAIGNKVPIMLTKSGGVTSPSP